MKVGDRVLYGSVEVTLVAIRPRFDPRTEAKYEFVDWEGGCLVRFDGDTRSTWVCLASIKSLPLEEDKIHHPKHYTQGVECWDYIVSHEMGYLEGNIIKYITRYKDKGGVEDLLKAQAYLVRLIVKEEKEAK